MPKRKQKAPKLSDKRRAYLKANFDRINPAKLSKAETYYYNKIKAGKARARKALRIEGKYLSGAIVDTIAKVAKSKKKNLQEYINENTKELVALIETGYTHVFKDIDRAIDIINDLRRKTVEVDTGNGIVRMSKHEAIELLSVFQQHVKSNTRVVMLATTVKTFKNNKIRITIPEGFEDYVGQDLIDFLDEDSDIFYVQS
jgi:hypothetical protein